LAQDAGGLAPAVARVMAGRQGTAVVMDVATGRVLAAYRLEVAERTLARPGSTVKPFVLAALVEGGYLRAAETLVCGRQVRLGGRNLDCSHAAAPRGLDGAAALAYSCNFFFAGAAARMGPARLAEALRRAIPPGAGRIEVAANAEQAQLQALGEWGVLVTPMQMLGAYRKLALKRAPAAVVEGLASAAAFGTARLAQPAGWKVAGKTGTSTEPGADFRHAWFLGYAPADAPKIAVLVFLASGRGGADAAPLAGEIFQAYFSGARQPSVTVRRYWLSRRNEKPVTVPLEEYVAAVLAGEATSFRFEEALKAMAVVVRTFAQRNRGRHKKEGFDFCDTTHCQDYRQVALEPRFTRAAEATRGEVLWYGGEPADVYYHAACAGQTEEAQFVWSGVRRPYLRQIHDAACTGTGEWRTEIPKDDLRRALASGGLRAPARVETLEVVSRTPSGRADRLLLEGSPGIPVSASSLRFAVGRALGWDLLPSTWFDAADAGDRVVFTGRGSGHGVGLCQAGAARMGESGQTYTRILAYYFPGTEAGVSARGFDWRAQRGERVEIFTAGAARDGRLAALADQAAREAEQRVGSSFAARPQVRVFPSVAAFRDATGEPGWVAASTRGNVVRLQPPAAMGDALSSTLRHEFLHMLVEARARAGLPLWFREGLVLYLADPARPAGDARVEDQDLQRARTRAEMDRAYQAARSRVAQLVERHGRETVLGWLTSGMPMPAPPSR
jgi:stage II sporulation protein D